MTTVTIIDTDGNEITGSLKYNNIEIGDLLFYIEWDSEDEFDSWHGTIDTFDSTVQEGTINAHFGVPGGDKNQTLNCVAFNPHPLNGKGYSTFHANFPDNLNPSITTITGASIVEYDYLVEQNYFEEEETS